MTQPGRVAQLVEQRTENPCVTGSTPVPTTSKKTPYFSKKTEEAGFFFCALKM
jgi:hypothetical protein